MSKFYLHSLAGGCYGLPADVNPSARFDSLNSLAGSRLYSDMRFFYARNPSCDRTMAGRDGEASAPAGSQTTGLSTPSRLATPFDSAVTRLLKYSLGAFHMATHTSSHPEFTFRFLAVRRSDLNDRPHRESVTAPDELTARRLLVRDFVLLFAARLPVQEVRHV